MSGGEKNETLAQRVAGDSFRLGALRALARAAEELERGIPASILATPHLSCPGAQVDQTSLREAASRIRRMFVALDRGEL